MVLFAEHMYTHSKGIKQAHVQENEREARSLEVVNVWSSDLHSVQIRGSREVFFKYCIPGSLKLYQNLHEKTHPILLKTVDLCLEMSSVSIKNFGFVTEEIFELGHTRKSQCFDT